MITLKSLAALAERYGADLDKPVAPVRIGNQVIDTDRDPVVMATVNLSRDSSYRESVAVSTESAIRKARLAAAQGAHCVDIGAESTWDGAEKVGIDRQIDQLVPVVKPLAADGIVVSVESYHPEVIEAGLDAGAGIVNHTGAADDHAIFALAAQYRATVVLCHGTTANVRVDADATLDDPLREMYELLDARVEKARAAGVTEIVLDPGIGFYYANLPDAETRIDYQTRVLAETFRLRGLGLPVCHALPHAFDLFEEEFRTAEGFFTVIARLGGTGVFRTHEVPRVVTVLRAMGALALDA